MDPTHLAPWLFDPIWHKPIQKLINYSQIELLTITQIRWQSRSSSRSFDAWFKPDSKRFVPWVILELLW